jgi:predicted metal-dependent phosphoesterase TrpH
MFRVDLHLHTVFSSDSTISPKLVVEQLHKHALIKGVAITDHDTLEGYFQVNKLANVYEDVVVLPGIEVGTEKGDIILLGVEEKPRIPTTLDSAIDFAKTTDGVIVIPHPYRSLGIGDLAMNVEAHAVEVLNPTATSKENIMAQNLARARKLPGVAGTDAHSPEELWTTFTEIDAQPDRESVLNTLKKGGVKAFAVHSSTMTKLEGGKIYSRD